MAKAGQMQRTLATRERMSRTPTIRKTLRADPKLPPSRTTGPLPTRTRDTVPEPLTTGSRQPAITLVDRTSRLALKRGQSLVEERVALSIMLSIN